VLVTQCALLNRLSAHCLDSLQPFEAVSTLNILLPISELQGGQEEVDILQPIALGITVSLKFEGRASTYLKIFSQSLELSAHVLEIT
jgi:hypothetical protein